MSKKNDNLTAKIFALVIAVILWSYVMGEVNPDITREFKNITVDYINTSSLDDDGLVILEPKEATVDVKITGKKSEIKKFMDNNISISAQADLSNAEVGKNHIPIDLKLINNISNVRLSDYQPREIVFEIDQMAEEEREVVLELDGELEENYIVGSAKLDPAKVTIKGPKSYLSKINKLVARVDVEGRNEDINKSVALEALDIDGKVIKNIVKNPNMINVSIPIIKKESASINLKTTGELPARYSIRDLTIEPSRVNLNIRDKDIEIESIDSLPVNILDLIGKEKMEIKLDLPDGVELENPNQRIIIRYKLLERGSKTLVYDLDRIENINLSEGMRASLEENDGLENIKIVIDGDYEELEGLEAESLNLSLDLEGLGVGVHEVDLIISGIDLQYVESIVPGKLSVKIEEE